MKQCIENPNEVDWKGFWAEKLANKVDKDWDKAAPGFYRRTKKEDYNDALFSKLILDKNDTVLDVYVTLYQGARIQETSVALQQNVKMAVQSMTGKPVTKVNVHIEGVVPVEKTED